MTIQELFEAERIDKDMLGDLAFESPYWASCDRFISDNWTHKIEGLSLKQAAWATRILDDCVEMRIEGRMHET